MTITILTEEQLSTLKQWFAVFANEKPMAIFKKGWKDPTMGIVAPRHSRHYKLAKKIFGKDIADLFADKGT